MPLPFTTVWNAPQWPTGRLNTSGGFISEYVPTSHAGFDYWQVPRNQHEQDRYNLAMLSARIVDERVPEERVRWA